MKQMVVDKDLVLSETAITIACCCDRLCEFGLIVSIESVQLLCLINRALIPVEKPTHVRTYALKTLASMTDTHNEDLLTMLSCGRQIEFLLGLVDENVERDPAQETSLVTIISNFTSSD